MANRISKYGVVWYYRQPTDASIPDTIQAKVSDMKRRIGSGKFLIALAVGALLLSLSLGCAPASGGSAASTGSEAAAVGVGKTSPPFAMTLADGSEVTSADIVADEQPVHLFWFATW